MRKKKFAAFRFCRPIIRPLYLKTKRENKMKSSVICFWWMYSFYCIVSGPDEWTCRNFYVNINSEIISTLSMFLSSNSWSIVSFLLKGNTAIALSSKKVLIYTCSFSEEILMKGIGLGAFTKTDLILPLVIYFILF